MKTTRLLALTSVVLSIWPVTLAAQTMTLSETRAVQVALDRGQLLFAYDQAAWHATDAMLADAASRGLSAKLPSTLGGWVVRGKADSPVVMFFDKASEPHAVFAVQTADGGRRVASTHFYAPGENAAIDGSARAMIRSLAVATEAFEAAHPQRCSAGKFNTAVLPADRPGGPDLVYFLTPQDSLDRVPFGGHYRIEVSANGVAGPVHAFTKACLDVASLQSREKPAALFVTQLLDPLPTEIAVFAMFVAGVPLYVGTPPDPRVWVVDSPGGQARISVVQTKTKAAEPPQ